MIHYSIEPRNQIFGKVYGLQRVCAKILIKI